MSAPRKKIAKARRAASRPKSPQAGGTSNVAAQLGGKRMGLSGQEDAVVQDVIGVDPTNGDMVVGPSIYYLDDRCVACGRRRNDHLFDGRSDRWLCLDKKEGLQVFQEPLPGMSGTDAVMSSQDIRNSTCVEFTTTMSVEEIKRRYPGAKIPERNQAAIEERDKAAVEYPRMVAVALIVRKGMILLEKRAPANVPGLDNCWDLPGGKLEKGETPQQAVVREIYEEMGVRIRCVRLLPEPIPSAWTYPDGVRHWLLVGCVCEIVEGEPVVNDHLQWFSAIGLPSSLLKTDRTMIEDYMQSERAGSISEAVASDHAARNPEISPEDELYLREMNKLCGDSFILKAGFQRGWLARWRFNRAEDEKRDERRTEQWLALYEAITMNTALLLGTRLPDGTWPHLPHCNGDRKFPPGEPGHGCCCTPVGSKKNVDLRQAVTQAKIDAIRLCATEHCNLCSRGLAARKIGSQWAHFQGSDNDLRGVCLAQSEQNLLSVLEKQA